MLGIIILVVVLIGFAVLLAKIRLERAKTEPLRKSVKHERVLLQVPVITQFEGWNGARTAVAALGMRLIVREHSFEIGTSPRFLGAVLGSDWVFRAVDTEMRSVSPRPSVNPRWWVEVTGSRLGKQVRVLFASATRLNEAWDALVAAGVRPMSSPPA